jgi:TatD DNase family protein
MFLNLHTHSPTLSPGVLEIENLRYGQPDAPTSAYRSVGLHPWFLEKKTLASAHQWLHEQAALPTTVAIGEAGLDKATATDWETQLGAFQYCYETSEAFGKPLVIHCVRAYGEILGLKKRWQPAQPWVFHGFDKNLQVAASVLQAGCWLSFGAALFRPNSHAAQALQSTPAERFFLETDVSDLSIGAVYERAAALHGISLGALQEQVWANARVFFPTLTHSS